MTNKNSIHKSGPLGRLLNSGKITSIDFEDAGTISKENFKTDDGIIFERSELLFVPTKECAPWAFANRSEKELEDISELTSSIKSVGQLQPILIRPKNTENPKYEIIFGRQRYEACKHLGIDVLAIVKNNLTDQEAALLQHDENNKRNNVSPYSESLNFCNLLSNKIFKNPKELMNHLDISKSSFYEILSLSKIPKEIVDLIPDIHSLSISLGVKIVSLIAKDKNNVEKIKKNVHLIGNRINSPAKLENKIKDEATRKPEKKVIKSANGRRLFTLATDFRGHKMISFDKSIYINDQDLVKLLLEHIDISGAPET